MSLGAAVFVAAFRLTYSVSCAAERERTRKLERESAGTVAGAVQQRRFSRERIWREKGKIVTSRIVSSQSRKSRF